MYYTVYKVTNDVNDKIYIGVHKTNDKNDDYIGSGKVLKRAIEKYGVEHFTKEILYECESEEEMFQRESKIVDEEFVSRKDTYNIKVGGQGGWDYVNDNGLSVGMGYNFINERKINNIVGQCYITANRLREDKDYARWFSLRIKKSMRNVDPYGKNNHMYGKKHTKESKKKIGKANSEHQKGKGNSQYGTCWIYSLEEKRNMKIKKEELSYYLKNQWIKGRKMDFL